MLKRQIACTSLCCSELSPPCGTYVFELKVDKPAALATTQAERKHYAAPYLAAGKPVWIIGLSFDSKTHELIDHCVERFE